MICHGSKSDHEYFLQVLTLNSESGFDLYAHNPSVIYSFA